MEDNSRRRSGDVRKEGPCLRSLEVGRFQLPRREPGTDPTTSCPNKLSPQADSFNFLHKMQLCATEVAGVGTFLNGEVRFNGIPVEIPSLQDLRITLRITSRSESAHNGGKSLVLRPYFGDESVWCHLPPHGHVLPFFFTAGPNMIFTPCLETVLPACQPACLPTCLSFSSSSLCVCVCVCVCRCRCVFSAFLDCIKSLLVMCALEKLSLSSDVNRRLTCSAGRRLLRSKYLLFSHKNVLLTAVSVFLEGRSHHSHFENISAQV